MQVQNRKLQWKLDADLFKVAVLDDWKGVCVYIIYIYVYIQIYHCIYVYIYIHYYIMFDMKCIFIYT